MPRSAVVSGIAVALNMAARTKREGGPKSPGRPSFPDPWPSWRKVSPEISTGGTLRRLNAMKLRRFVMWQSKVGELVIMPSGLSWSRSSPLTGSMTRLAPERS